jgi:4-hydroxy-tetrahydrodipicolinate reductase
MTRVLVSGSCGRMGSVVASLVQQQSDLQLMGGLEAFGHPQLGMPLGKGRIVSDLKAVVDDADVVVEFGPTEAAIEHLGVAADRKKPFVLGTTGFSAGQLREIERLAKSVPVVCAPNFSAGIAVLSQVAAGAARLLGAGYDCEIVEAHHRNKKDAPSGTAKKLAEALGQAGWPKVAVHSIRAGDIVGDHTVILAGEGERLELSHKATSRVAFGQGVLRAIRFVVGKPNGAYTIEDVLGLKQA